MKAGLECGIGIANYNDIKPGDVIEFFTTEKVKETLRVSSPASAPTRFRRL